MQHLEVNWMSDTDLERLVRFILMKTGTQSPRLHSLQIYVRKSRDDIVDKLQTMIDSEKLFSDYTIKRSGNIIVLKWKKQHL